MALIISALQSSTAERLLSPMEAAVSTAMARDIHEQVAEKKISKLVKDAVRQSVAIWNVVSTIAHRFIGRDDWTAPISHFAARTVEEEIEKDENVRKKEDTGLRYSHLRHQRNRLIWILLLVLEGHDKTDERVRNREESSRC